MKKDPGKKIRIEQLARKNTVKKVIKDTFIMLLMVVEPEIFDNWLKTTKSFAEMLVRIGDESFGDKESFAEGSWERKLCEICMDVADKYLSAKEMQKAKIGTPKEICYWFSGFLKSNFSKKELNWDGGIFDAKEIEKRVVELGIHIEQTKHENPVS